MVSAGQPSPGGLDRRRRGAGPEPEDGVGIASGHPPSLAAEPRDGGPLDRVARPSSHSVVSTLRRAGAVAALVAAPVALAVRFAHVYRERAGFPRRRPPLKDPADLGLPFEETMVSSPAGLLPAWFIPANGGKPGPGVLLVHGWDSARDRTLPNIRLLHAAGFHCLTFDVRGHGANPAEALPVSGGEYGADAEAAFDALLARPEVTRGAILGHSMGGIGAILAAAADPRVAALVSVATPSDPRLLVHQTFRLARLPIPDLVAHPLAWLTTRVFVQPRGHAVRAISARHAIGRYRGPILLIHGELDEVMPPRHLAILEAAARASRRDDADAPPIETLIVAGGRHTWLYEDPIYRRTVARFLARELGGPLDPDVAGDVAAATPSARLAEPEESLVGDRATNVAAAVLGASAEP